MFVSTFVLFITLQAALHAAGADAKHNSNDKIKYPGPIQEYDTNSRYGDSSEDEVPEECKGKNYCTIRPANYPQQKYDSIIKYKIVLLSDNAIRLKRTADLEGNSTKLSTDSKIPVETPDTEVSDLIDKQGDPEEVDNCETQVEFEPLYKIKSREGDWRNVVQSPSKNFVQSVRLEICRERDAPCFNVFPKIPTYTTFCKQKFTTWHLVVDSNDPNSETKTEKIPVDLPTCCSCHYKSRV